MLLPEVTSLCRVRTNKMSRAPTEWKQRLWTSNLILPSQAKNSCVMLSQVSQATELSELTVPARRPPYYQRYRTLRTASAEFRIHLALSILAGAMPPDGETIALYPPMTERPVSLSSQPNNLSFMTIASRYR